MPSTRMFSLTSHNDRKNDSSLYNAVSSCTTAFVEQKDSALLVPGVMFSKAPLWLWTQSPIFQSHFDFYDSLNIDRIEVLSILCMHSCDCSLCWHAQVSFNLASLRVSSIVTAIQNLVQVKTCSNSWLLGWPAQAELHSGYTGTTTCPCWFEASLGSSTPHCTIDIHRVS